MGGKTFETQTNVQSERVAPRPTTPVFKEERDQREVGIFPMKVKETSSCATH